MNRHVIPHFNGNRHPKMKRAAVLLSALLLACSATACGRVERETETSYSLPTEESSLSGQGTENPPAVQTRPTENDAETEQTNRILVAYFSATNTTEGVAERMAEGLNADLYEIIPQEPYTDADLDYNDKNSRSTIEMNDPDSRPAISGSVENMEQYDIVFIGYPIWWGDAPRIVSTFVESYDLSGKTVIPFCTSGGSGIGSSGSNLEQLTSGAEWLAGRKLGGSDSKDVIMEWVNSLGLDLNGQ